MHDNDFEGFHQLYKERVKKNPERVNYAISQFKKHDIEFHLINPKTGHFHCYRKSDDKLFQFYAGTEKIVGYEKERGIHTLIRLLEE